MSNFVITISRQYGSGGRFIAKKLADRLGIPFYDNEIITMSAKESGYAENIFEKAEQMSSHSFLYSVSMFGSAAGVYGLPLSDKVFLVQSDIIKKCADAGPCVIVGRCADYVLRDYPDVINFYLYSDIDSKIERYKKYYNSENKSDKDIRDEIIRRDKKRGAYYNYYTTQRWGEIENYHLSVHTDSVGIDGCVDILEKFVLNYGKKTNGDV